MAPPDFGSKKSLYGAISLGVPGTAGIASGKPLRALQTRYYVPLGELLTFERGGSTYQVHSDALGTRAGHHRLDRRCGGALRIRRLGQPAADQHPAIDLRICLSVCGGYGVRFDAITGFHYMRNRWYDGQIGRFISRDPLRFKNFSENKNLYACHENQPTQLIDPLGLLSIDSNNLTPAQIQALIDAFGELYRKSAPGSDCSNFFKKVCPPDVPCKEANGKSFLKGLLDNVQVSRDDQAVESTGSRRAAAPTGPGRCNQPYIKVHHDLVSNPLPPRTLPSILAHELLHIVTGLHDGDPRFTSLLDRMSNACGLTNPRQLPIQ